MAKELNLRGRHNGEDARQTQPKVDQGPLSPKEIDALYKKDRIHSSINDRDGDGLVDRTQHAFDVKIQKPQFPEDLHDEGHGKYSNNVSIKAWTRGGDATVKPGYVFTGNPKPAKGGGKCEATGADIKSSPFSAAAKTWQD